MDFPVNFVIGGVIIPSHFIFDVLAFYIGVTYYLRISATTRDHIHENTRWYIIVAGAMGALIGSRLLAALERPYLFLHPPSLLFYYANATIAGGILGSIIVVEIAKKIMGERKRTGDLFVYPLILGMIIGRIGCFLTGVTDSTVGLPSKVPWALDQGDGIARHPTSLYEIIFLGILWITLHIIKKKVPLQQGVLFRLFIINYFSFRFFIEFIKPVQPIFMGLSAIQIASAAIVIYYGLTLLFSNTHWYGTINKSEYESLAK